MNEFYVYVLFRPDGSPCYIGKGCKNRWLHHERGKCSNKRLARIIAYAGRELPKVKIRVALSDAEAREIETALIKAIGRGRRGPLVNMTDGGEGIAGSKMPPEICRKISASHVGRKFTDEHRANISRARKALFAAKRAAGIKVTLSPEHREAIRRGHVGKTMSTEACAKMSAAKKGKPIPHRSRMSTKGIPKSPEHRAKLAARLTAMNKARAKSAIALGNGEGF